MRGFLLLLQLFRIGKHAVLHFNGKVTILFLYSAPFSVHGTQIVPSTMHKVVGAYTKDHMKKARMKQWKAAQSKTELAEMGGGCVRDVLSSVLVNIFMKTNKTISTNTLTKLQRSQSHPTSIGFLQKFPIFLRLCTILSSKYVSFSVINTQNSICNAQCGSFMRNQQNTYLGCLVISNLSLKKGRAPLTCKIHLPPSMTAISSWLISSLPHCQVKNSFFLLFHTRNLVDVL